MVSNSRDHLASQQSIKAYVDNTTTYSEGTGIDISSNSISLDSNIKGVILGVTESVVNTNTNFTLNETPSEPGGSVSSYSFTTSITVPSGFTKVWVELSGGIFYGINGVNIYCRFKATNSSNQITYFGGSSAKILVGQFNSYISSIRNRSVNTFSSQIETLTANTNYDVSFELWASSDDNSKGVLFGKGVDGNDYPPLKLIVHGLRS